MRRGCGDRFDLGQREPLSTGYAPYRVPREGGER